MCLIFQQITKEEVSAFVPGHRVSSHQLHVNWSVTGGCFAEDVRIRTLYCEIAFENNE